MSVVKHFEQHFDTFEYILSPYMIRNVFNAYKFYY